MIYSNGDIFLFSSIFYMIIIGITFSLAYHIGAEDRRKADEKSDMEKELFDIQQRLSKMEKDRK